MLLCIFPIDLPVIISEKKLAYLEPQEKVWKGESGQWFDISELQVKGLQDSLAPFNGICDFSASTTLDYSGTLFRFPLRDTPSELSENVYTVSKLHELLTALKEEAKFLLLFLRSIDTIEVFELPQHGGQQQLFRVEIAEKEQTYRHRKHFMDQLKSAHESQSYSVSKHINVVTNFHVAVTDGGHTTRSHWLVANQVGSPSSKVHTAAVKQHVFPWVGVALELKDGSAPTPTSSGRIFCFLPMPAEASSPLPVHVNGTFGLNDDRRTLKWPGIERKNDPTAEWNTLLVSQLLPPCYALLLNRAKDLLTPKEYYSALPEVSSVQYSNWKDLLLPLFHVLMSEPVVWTERLDTKVGRWIVPSEGVFVPREGNFSLIVHCILSSCGVKLVDVPSRIWDAFQLAGFSPSSVSPSLTRNHIRIQSGSYMSIDAHSKYELLRYCLTDQQYSDLQGLFLLPLADGRFEQFTSGGLYNSSQYRYLCSGDYPQDLLPNLNDQLINLHENDSDLQTKLLSVASSQRTQLRSLDTQAVAQLLPHCFPQEWHSCKTVSLPHPFFPSEWFEKFWRWVRTRDLHTFVGQLILPVVSSKQSGFDVTMLTGNSPVLLFSEQCSTDFLQAQTKLQVRYTNTSEFPYLYHKYLPSYVNEPSPSGILTAIANAHQRNITEIQTVKLSPSEASIIQVYLSTQLFYPNSAQQKALSSLPVLSALNQDKLYSANEAAQSTWNSMIVMEPEGFDINYRCLPRNLIVISRAQNHIAFLNSIPGIKKPTKVDFILKFLFPMIRNNTYYPSSQIDDLMKQILSMSHHFPQLTSELSDLKFLKTSISSSTRKSPKELFDPSHQSLKELYLGEPVFPIDPFDQLKYVLPLRECGLRHSVTAQEIVQIIESIAGTSTGSFPQSVTATKISRLKAVLACLSSESLTQLSFDRPVTVRRYHSFTLKTALQVLASQYSWLPVRSLPPERYPECLSWKGSTCTSHLTSLHGSVLFPCHGDHDELPTITGSQVYVVDCTPSQALSTIFASSHSTGLVEHVLAHFQHMLKNHHKIDTDQVDHTVHMIYRYLQRSLSTPDSHRQLQKLQSLEWIWIRRHQKFVHSKMIVLKPNPSFRHDLEPYLYVLPDELSKYSTLFATFGVTTFATQSQIISVLKMVRDTDSSQLNANETWGTVTSILAWLTDNGEKCVDLLPSEALYVPIESDADMPLLENASEVVYTDSDFLKAYLKSSETEETRTFVHHRIHRQMAHCLGLTPLTEDLDISEDTFEDAGQSEPLIQRLKNILRDYDGSLTIIKELIQNADDAGASEMNICFDARTHDIFPKHLLLAGMAECHGPALVVHNNASFTDEDFTNIQKLAGATKQDKPLKIGKFGVGFCSVYHITDVPSFVSRDRLYIFDPTLKYLKQDINDRTRPGKKVTFTKKLVTSSKQLLPYENLYGFNRKESYSGTMFRLPFRNMASEISGVIFSEKLVDQLINDMKKCSSKLLLFLRNVKQITFSQINPGEESPHLILDIRKEVINQFDTNSEAVCLHQNYTPTLHSPTLVHVQEQHWLVASHTGKICSNYESKDSTAAVACQLEQKPLPFDTVYIPQPVAGEVFCFLPLTLQTGLPVHVCSNFAVMNDRKGIRSSDDNELSYCSSSSETQWNIELMKQTIPKAYHNLLATLQQMCTDKKIEEHEYNFFSLWPLQAKLKTSNPWNHFITPLYRFVCSSDLFYCTFLSQWQTLAESRILSPGILCHSAYQAPLKCILDVVEKLQLPVVSLADSYRNQLPKAECAAVTITEEGFVERFFENIASLVGVRNEVLEHLLQTFAVVTGRETCREEYLKRFISENECIPCSPTGVNLKLPTEIINPYSTLASLYDSEDGVFPLQQLYNNRLVRTALNQLGMISSSLPLSMLTERAKSIQHQYSMDKLKTLKRVNIILSCIAELPKHAKLKPIAEICFLPVMKKPCDYPLKWYGDEYYLLSAKELVKGESNAILAGSQVPIACEELPKNGGCGYIPYRVMTVLGIQTCPTDQQVINHLCHLIEVFEAQQPILPGPDTPSIDIKFVENTCLSVYQWLESRLANEILKPYDPLFTQLQHKPCVWNGKQFVSPHAVAKCWDHNGPYLFSLPLLLTSRPHLTTAIHIREKFVTEDFLVGLKKMFQEFRSVSIDDKCQKAMPILLQALQEATDLPEDFTCYLPDTLYLMHDAKELAYNDAPWCEVEGDWTFVNKSIPRDAAQKLGVKMIRSKLLEEYESSSNDFGGVPFGQKEELTRRIKNILREYPFDETVLKELLQNADDAKAKRMYIILDKRRHGTKCLPSDNWKDLQGPALLVWNDNVFSEDDLSGIQRLGLGNKRTDAESIGMFGIGFNVVYHLTDCPSFISNGTTLCILDPHCRYVPGANELKPGRRYDNLDEKFWTHWPDLKAAYLQDELSNCPSEIKTGTLFRFPLRSTEELVKKSKLLDSESPSARIHMCITDWKMQHNLKVWACSLKQALLFLNHVIELKFFVIENMPNSEMKTTHWFEVSLDEPATVVIEQDELHRKVAAFARTGSEPYITRPYSMTCIDKSAGNTESERWLIQKGVGDVDNRGQDWIYAPQVKPRHGIAARLESVNDGTLFRGRVFCFLPLPVSSRLPVHINGSFVLSNSRRSLWHSTDTDHPDDGTKWNQKLIEAIASSYAKLLVTAREFYIVPECYDSKEKLEIDIQQYYHIFPTWLCEPTPENLYKGLAKMVYRKLDSQNANILITIKAYHEPLVAATDTETSISTVNSFMGEWHPLHSPDVSQQSYFWSDSKIAPILERIGMNLTAAPKRIRCHFKDSKADDAIFEDSKADDAIKLPEVSQKTVYQYYSTFSEQVSKTGFPCHIKDTVFLSIPNFQQFVLYLLSDSKDKLGCREFPGSPFDLPLLLTADNQLRNFDEENKVIKSKFLYLFPQNQEKFLHPELQQPNYVETYFLQPRDDNWSIVRNILSATLPLSFCTSRVHNAEQYIETLKSLWKCLLNDPVFSHYLKVVVEYWALLPSTNYQLFSFRPNRLMPIIDSTDSSSEIEESPISTSEATEHIFELLKQAGMPILDTNIVPSPQDHEIDQFCPALSNTVKILSNLYYLHEEGTLQVFLSTTPHIDGKIEILFKYLGQIHFADKTYRDSLKKVKSLPLFRNIDGNLCTLLGTVYIWPGTGVCLAGSDKWVKETKCVFLKPGGMWRKLQVQQSVLGIKTIAALHVYTFYIFPHFYLLNETERLQQLKHIRDHLFDNAKGMSELNYQHCLDFISALKNLRCILHNDTLKPISDFSDPEVELFKTFGDSFLFLPEELSNEMWLEFFRKIGLRTKVSMEKFTEFCQTVSKGRHKNLQKASSVLLAYLFQAKEWHDKKDFLRQVSQIPFVCTETLPHLNWIKPIHSAENTVMKDQNATHMTRLCGAATYGNASLLWTLKSVVYLPALHDYPESDKEAFYNAMGVIQTPCIDDVIKNVCNISKSRYSNFSLFDRYNNEYKMKQTSEERCSLLDVMLDNFAFFQERECPESKLKQLNGVSCVPVLAQDDITTPVLVEPQQVVAASEIKFQPFLNPLPKQLYTVQPILSCMGVEGSVGPAHIRFALEKAYTTASGEPLEPNTQEVVKHLLIELHSLLQSNSHSSSEAHPTSMLPEVLKPLYLPSIEHKLISSTVLFYPDRGYHRTTDFKFSSSQYSLFSLISDEQMHGGSFVQKLTEKEFCQQLPQTVSPRALSACTINMLQESRSISDVQLPLAERLESLLASPSLTKAVNLIFFKLYIGPNADAVRSTFLTALEQFLRSITVITMKTVKADILLAVDPERNKKIATRNFKFLFQKKTNDDDGSEVFCLYVSAELKNSTTLTMDRFFESLANEVLSHVAQMSGIDPNNLKSHVLSYFLKAETNDEISSILEENFAVSATAVFESSTFFFSPKLGECIPKYLHYRLDVDMHNIFRPEEWIGYGEVEDTVQYARVGYRIPQGHGSELTDEYLIYTSPDDDEGTTASAIDMYKFLRGPAGNQQSDADSNALCTFEGESETVQLRQALDADDLKAIKKQICADLKCISKLPDGDQKRKAIKRLYLKWHPDKNPHPLATKAFQYLQRQIERIKNGKSLEDSDEEETVAYSPSPNSDNDWDKHFPQWNQTAGAHRSRSTRETTLGGFQAEFPAPQREPRTARVWIAQAESDLEALNILLKEVDIAGRVCCQVCFLAHEVAEKALKAGKYAVCGLDPGSLTNHNLTSHAIGLEQEKSSILARLGSLASSLETYYLDTRFPNRYAPPSIPSHHYNSVEARTAARTAEDIFHMMKQVVEES